MKKINSIGLLLLSVLLNPKVSNAQIVVQPSQYVNSGGVLSGPIYAPTSGGCALPPYTFIGDTDTGIGYVSANAFSFTTNGTCRAEFKDNHFQLASDATLSFSTTTDPNAAQDIFAYRSAAKTLKIDTDGAGGSLTDVIIQAALTTSGSVTATGGTIPASDLGSSSGSTSRRWDTVWARTFENVRSSLGTTSTDGTILENTTAATGGATVQISPRLRFRGNAWDTSASETVDFFIENLPATAATPTGTLKFGYSLNGAAATYPATLTSAGLFTTLAQVRTGDGTESVPAHSFTSETTSGLRWAGGSGGLVLVGGGVDGARFSAAPSMDVRSDFALRWNSTGAVVGTPDTAIKRSAADIIQFNNGTAATGGTLEMFEKTAPTAPAANGVRMFSQDNGAGKTQLCAIFNTGAVQCFAQQP